MPVPIYEYRCEACNHKFSVLIGVVADSGALICPTCKDPNVRRLVSKFIRGRSDDSRIDEIADQLESFDEDVPNQKMREIVRELGKATDEDSSGELEEMFEADLEGKLGDEE